MSTLTKIVVDSESVLASGSKYISYMPQYAVSGDIVQGYERISRCCRCVGKFLTGPKARRGSRDSATIVLVPTLCFYVLRQLGISDAFRSHFIHTAFVGGCIRRCQSTDDAQHCLLSVYVPWEQLCILDKSWVYRIERLISERIELDDMMAWLSTLGGAFSSLGDTFSDCAIYAGKISVRQWKIATKVGDPIILAKCKLYMAISLMQLGEIHRPKVLIRQLFRFAVGVSKKYQDYRLENMCRGAWAKLQFLHQQRKPYKPRNYLLAFTGPATS